MKRIAAIDYGNVRIGLAISDPTQAIASPLQIVENRPSRRETAEAIAKVLEDYMPIEAIVMGLPLLMNGRESPGCREVRELLPYLEEVTGLEIVLWDERLTTAQVERTLKEAKVRRKQRSSITDPMAASAILHSYLETNRQSPHNESHE